MHEKIKWAMKLNAITIYVINLLKLKYIESILGINKIGTHDHWCDRPLYVGIA